MDDLRTLVRDEMARAGSPSYSFNDLGGGRDRKRRNKRIAAGVVGIAVFAVAVWIVTSIGSLDRSESSVVPGASGITGPAETGPGGETGPAIRAPYEYDPTADFVGLPPEGARPSGQETSELVAGGPLIHVGWVYVFEDGRAISNSDIGISNTDINGSTMVTFDSSDGLTAMPPGTIEQRLTPEGVEMVRSGAIRMSDFICFEDFDAGNLAYGCKGPRHQIPPSAWEDSTLRPYVPYRYAICGAEPLGMFPEAAQDLLRGTEAKFGLEWTNRRGECFEVTTEEARTLDGILADAGFLIRDNPSSYERWVPNSSVPELMTVVTFSPILPHGTFGSMGGG